MTHPHLSNFESLASEARLRLSRRLRDHRVEEDLRDAFGVYWNSVVEAHARRHASQPSNLPPSASSLLGLFLLVALSEAADVDEAMLEGAAGCELYFLAVTLFDAIEDDELEFPWSEFPTAAVINAALIMFVLASDSIATIGSRTAGHDAARRIICIRSLRSGSGQHRDIAGLEPSTLEDAVDVARAKTASIPMTFELAAIAAGCQGDRVAQYGRIGSDLAFLRQSVNDLRDLYGKSVSTDLVSGKSNLVVAAFRTRATTEQRRDFDALREALPASMPRMRELVFGSGALETLAHVMEEARLGLHRSLEELGLQRTPIAAVATHADQLVSTLYAPTNPQ